MRLSTTRSIRVATAVGLVCAVISTCANAYAAMTSVARADTTGSSASWGADAVAPGAQLSGTDYVILWSGGVATQYFDVVNTGSMSLLSTTWSVHSVVPKSLRIDPDITFDACVGGSWSQRTGSCSGTVVRVGITKRGKLAVSSSVTPAAPGSRLSVRATTSSQISVGEYTTSVKLSVSRDQARAGATSSS